MGQTRVGLQGIQPVGSDWWAVFQAETFFNPQSGEIANSLESLAARRRSLSRRNSRTPSESGGTRTLTLPLFPGLEVLFFEVKSKHRVACITDRRNGK